jgi:hypothetical protein
MAKLQVFRWRTVTGLLLAANASVAALWMSEAQAYYAPCISDQWSPPQENCWCGGWGGGAQCNSLHLREEQCASNTINGTFMPIWDPMDGGEWTERSCEDDPE